MTEPKDVWDKANPDGIYAQLEKLETAIGLPIGFCASLRETDDWSFIIKLHALLEAAVAHLLVVKFDQDSLMPIFSRLPLSEVGTGKLAFAEKLGLLESDERGFIRSISELRNRIVHDVRNVSFNLTEYVRQLDKNQMRHFAKITGYSHAESESKGNEKFREFMIRMAKTHVFTTGLYTLAIIHLQIETVRLHAEHEQQTRKNLETIAATISAALDQAQTPLTLRAQMTEKEKGLPLDAAPLRG